MNLNAITTQTIKASTLYKKSRALSAAEVEAFGQRIEAIRAETLAKVGPEDAAYIYKIRDYVRYSEITSRGLLMAAGWLPPVWLFATGLLGVSKIVENMELGHNVMHGQFDWLNDSSLKGATYDWDNVCPGDAWRHSHNYMHHTYTNIIGKDRDVGYGILRIAEEQPWKPSDVFNVPKTLLLALAFEWGVGLHDLETEQVIAGKKPAAQMWNEARPVIRKIARQVAKDYIFFPVIAGPNALPVLAGNFTANIIRNLWAFAIIFCGHFTAESEMFEDNLSSETKAEWYLRQLKGSGNLTGGKWFHILSGNLSHQIEHHMFPDVPANRYAEMAPKVRALCEEYGQYYNTGSFRKQFSEVIVRIVAMSFPNEVRQAPRSLMARFKGWVGQFA